MGTLNTLPPAQSEGRVYVTFTWNIWATERDAVDKAESKKAAEAF